MLRIDKVFRFMQNSFYFFNQSEQALHVRNHSNDYMFLHIKVLLRSIF